MIQYDMNFVTHIHTQKKDWNASENILMKAMYIISFVKQI